MSARNSFRSAFGILTAVSIAAVPLAAQESHVIVSSGGKLAAAGNLPISDAAVQALVAVHFPEALSAGTESNALTIIVDANGQYVSGKASKATIITRTSSDGNVAIDTTIGGAHVMMRHSDDAAAAASAAVAAGGVVIARSSSEGGSAMAGAKSASGGIFGTDIPMSSVAAIGMRHYAAGELGSDPIMVSVIKLK